MRVNVSVRRGVVAALLLVTAQVGAIADTAGTANAVVPGANGRLVFSRQICQTEDGPVGRSSSRTPPTLRRLWSLAPTPAGSGTTIL